MRKEEEEGEGEEEEEEEEQASAFTGPTGGRFRMCPRHRDSPGTGRGLGSRAQQVGDLRRSGDYHPPLERRALRRGLGDLHAPEAVNALTH